MRAVSPRRVLAVAAVLASGLALASESFAFEVEQVVSPGGIEAWLVEMPDPPVISLRLAFEGGNALDPEGKEGHARFVSFMLDEGAGDMESEVFQDALVANSISLGFTAAADRFAGTLYTLSEKRDLAFSLLGSALSAPRFDPEPLERMRTMLLSNLQAELTDPTAVAVRLWAATAFPDHAYGRPPSGTFESLAAITEADLRGFATSRFARDNLTIAVVGDISAEELAPLLDSTFGVLPEHAGPWELPPAEMQGLGETLLIEVPLPQTVIIFGQPGPGRGADDRFATAVVTHVLGGPGFLTRLMFQMRELRGLTYGVNAWMDTADQTGMIQGVTSTVNERAGEALDLLREQWALMHREGPTAEEVENAKLYLQGSFALGFNTTGSIASQLLDWQVLGYPPTYDELYREDVEAVTPELTAEAAQRWFAVEDMLTIVLGQPVGITPTRVVDAAEVKGLTEALDPEARPK
jgi:zinc protease